MIIFPAIDIYGGKAVRLYKGDYSQMTVYNDDPVRVAHDLASAGAGYIHLVDLEGAKNGGTPNFGTVCAVKRESGLFCEIGGGVRSMEIIAAYIEAGIDRVILGTAAVEDPALLKEAVREYGCRIAVGIDLKDGMAAVRGWTEQSGVTAQSMFEKVSAAGVSTVICTDISKDGAMGGASPELYSGLSDKYRLNIIASGGVSSLEDVRSLKRMGLYGAILGKAYYTGAIDIAQAIAEAK